MDDSELAAACKAQRAKLRAHCYRMTGSADEAEDLVQETLLRAWRGRTGFAGRAQVATWLYRIATNVCLDALAERPSRILPQDVVRAVSPDDEPRSTPPFAPELPWLTPYPDDAETRESVGLAFLAALQHLPARQRAALLLCDVVGFSAQETADALDATVPAVTSLLQRARATAPYAPLAPPTDDERALLARYIAAWERADASALIALLTDDARFAMPPAKLWFAGRAAIADLFARYPMGFHGTHRMVAIEANGAIAVAAYLNDRFGGIHVLRVAGGQIAEITAFGAMLCKAFARPMSFSAGPV